MKEAYIAPELKIMCFAPVERLAGLPAEEYAQMLGGSPAAQGVSVDTTIDNGEGSVD